MGRRKITSEFYQALVDAFRECPGNATGAARTVREATGTTCDRRTAARAWTRGWPEHNFPPVEKTLELEVVSARAALVVIANDSADLLVSATSDEAIVREQARIDAIKARTDEGRLVRIARENVVALLESSNELLDGYRKLAPKVKKILANMDGNELDVTEAARLLWRVAIAARASTDAGMRVLQMERLLLGQPMEIIGVRDMDLDESDVLEELEEAASMAARIRERRARRGDRLKLLQGGKATDKGNGAAGPSRASGANGKGE